MKNEEQLKRLIATLESRLQQFKTTRNERFLDSSIHSAKLIKKLIKEIDKKD